MTARRVEAWVKVTYFPYSQLHHYEPVLQQQTSQSPVVYPDNWQAQPFFDAEGNPSTPFRANNPPNGCRRRS